MRSVCLPHINQQNKSPDNMIPHIIASHDNKSKKRINWAVQRNRCVSIRVRRRKASNSRFLNNCITRFFIYRLEKPYEDSSRTSAANTGIARERTIVSAKIKAVNFFIFEFLSNISKCCTHNLLFRYRKWAQQAGIQCFNRYRSASEH